MVGIIEFVFGFILGVAVAIRGFTLRPDLLFKFKDAIAIFGKKEKRFSKPSPIMAERDKGDFL